MLFLGLEFLFQKPEPACTYEQIVELQDHPFYVGVQFHPEFKSRPRRPSPPFTGEILFLLLKNNLQNRNKKVVKYLDPRQVTTGLVEFALQSFFGDMY